jgi:hypothetical protein
MGATSEPPAQPVRRDQPRTPAASWPSQRNTPDSDDSPAARRDTSLLLALLRALSVWPT